MVNKHNHVVLFVDDGDVAGSSGLARVIHPATKHPANPVFGPGPGLDNCDHITLGTVRKEAGKYRMWYYGYRIRGTSLQLYAESNDGLSWVRPNLGMHEDFDGNKENNIFLNWMAMRYPGAKLPEGRCAQIHPSVLYAPERGAERAYTLFSFDYGRHSYGPTDGYYIAFSPDGLHWNDGPYEPVIPGHADTGWFMYDERDKVFRGMVRQDLVVRRWRRRCILSTESADGLEWTLPKTPFVPDEQDDEWAKGSEDSFYTQFYAMPIFRYRSVLLGFLQVFKCTDGKQSMDGVIDLQLCSSRDGRHWSRVGDRSPIVRRGGDQEWDWGIVESGNSLIINGDEVWLYYLGLGCTHGKYRLVGGACRQHLGIATWPRDRFVGLRAGSSQGQLAVKTSVGGRSLYVNANAAGGELAVELAEPDGKPIPGFEAAKAQVISSDSLDHVVNWKGNLLLSRLQGKAVQVNFSMTNAEIFSLRWA
jgi:hypothetical protein